MDRSHVTEAMEVEIADPRRADDRAADAAFAAASALAFIAANHVVPVVGGVVAAVGISQAQHLRSQLPRRDPAQHVVEEVDHQLACRTLPRATPEWRSRLPWCEIAAGEEVDLPEGLAHPSEVGFEPTRLAKYVGQRADWAHPLADGSRLHAHEWTDGSVTLHRDRVDPARGPGAATVHWLSETSEGNALGAVLLAVGVGALTWMVVVT